MADNMKNPGAGGRRGFGKARSLWSWARFEYIADVAFVVAALYLVAEAAWLVLR